MLRVRAVWPERGITLGPQRLQRLQAELARVTSTGTDLLPLAQALGDTVPTMIVRPDEVMTPAARPAGSGPVTWHFKADKVRDDHGNHLVNIQLTFDAEFPEGEAGQAARDFLPNAPEDLGIFGQVPVTNMARARLRPEMSIAAGLLVMGLAFADGRARACRRSRGRRRPGTRRGTSRARRRR